VRRAQAIFASLQYDKILALSARFYAILTLADLHNGSSSIDV
jgi:hypothetical protein